jgi:hypothetical protein
MDNGMLPEGWEFTAARPQIFNPGQKIQISGWQSHEHDELDVRGEMGPEAA